MEADEPTIRGVVVDILCDMTRDWDIDPPDEVGPDTRLVADLEFSSIDIIHLVVAIEDHFKRGKLGFDELLMHESQYVDDLSVEQLTGFLSRKLNGG